MTEETEFEFKSKKREMHACGHDGHGTMLLGAAKLIKGVLESGKEIIPEEVRREGCVFVVSTGGGRRRGREENVRVEDHARYEDTTEYRVRFA